MNRISLGPVSLYFPVVFNITLGADLRQADEFVCWNRQVQYLAEFYGPHRQGRPYVGGRQSVAQRMSAVVCPDIPIVVRFSLGVLSILVVQESNYFVQHRLGNGNARAKHGSRELQGKISADTLVRYEILETQFGDGARGSVKFHTLVDALADHVTHRGREMGLG